MPQASLPPAREPLARALLWVFTAAVVILSVVLGYVVLGACGLRLFGTTWQMPWCTAREAPLARLHAAEDQNRILRDQVHEAELALLAPELCGPRVERRSDVPPPLASPPQDQRAEADEPLPDCPPGQVAHPPKSVAIVLDGSGSMNFSANLPPEIMERDRALAQRELALMQKAKAPIGSPLDMLRRMSELASEQASVTAEREQLDRDMRALPGPSRMQVAQEAVTRTIEGAPGALPIVFTTFGSCENIQSAAYGPDQRRGLIGRIAALRPDQGTPLARALLVTADALKGGDNLNDPVNIVIVSDGRDSCEGDPCAAARQIKARKPGVKVNVIDLSQNDELACITEATGGKLSRGHGEGSELLRELQIATGHRDEGACNTVPK